VHGGPGRTRTFD